MDLDLRRISVGLQETKKRKELASTEVTDKDLALDCLTEMDVLDTADKKIRSAKRS